MYSVAHSLKVPGLLSSLKAPVTDEKVLMVLETLRYAMPKALKDAARDTLIKSFSQVIEAEKLASAPPKKEEVKVEEEKKDEEVI